MSDFDLTKTKTEVTALLDNKEQLANERNILVAKETSARAGEILETIPDQLKDAIRCGLSSFTVRAPYYLGPDKTKPSYMGIAFSPNRTKLSFVRSFPFIKRVPKYFPDHLGWFVCRGLIQLGLDWRIEGVTLVVDIY